MSRLAALQADFQALLLGRPNDVAAHVLDGPRAGRATLLGVYAEAYALRLLEALGENYPTIAALIGAEPFDAMGRAYLAAHPSRYRSIRWFGDRLAGFLGATAPWSATPALAELALWEWTLRDAFDAADAVPAGLDAMAGVPPAVWPGLTFRLLPSFRRLDLRHGVVGVWRAVQDGGAGIEPPPAQDEATAWAVWRPELIAEYRSLPADEAWALAGVAEGADFAALCEGLAAWHEADLLAGRAAGLLRGWLEQGMLAEVRPPEDVPLSGVAP